MAKPTRVWGIDIGQCALKALRLEIVDGKPTATAYDYIEHPKILSQPDADPDALTREALDKFLSRNQPHTDLIAISVPGQSGLARFVKLPPVEEKKIPDIVRFEAKQQIPFPLEEVVWDYQKISGGEVIENFAMETEVGLFAMKREMISSYLGKFNAVSLECQVVQMAPLALTNFANYEVLKRGGPDAPPPEEVGEDTPRGKKRCAVVLDIGTDSSNLIITDGGKIIWQRPIALGGNNFTRVLTKEMKLTFAKAEHVKRNAAKSPDLPTILKALRPVLQDFVGEVQRSLGYFTNTHRDAHVGYMVGLGSAFRLPGLQKYMADKLSLDVRKPSGFDRLSGDQVKNDPVFTENILTFPIAYGLALQGLNHLGERKDFGRINTNLLPQEIIVDRQIRAKKPWAAAAAAALLLGTGTLAFGYAVQHGAVTDAAMKKAAADADNAVKEAGSQTTAKTTAEGENNTLQEAVKAVIAGNDDRLNFARLHEVVAIALPRAGQGGNLLDGPQQQQLWSNELGMKAIAKSKERIRVGIPLEKINEEDLTSYLAQVNVDSVYTRYTDNLKGFFDSADKYVRDEFGKTMARDMLPAEKEEVEELGKKREKPKGPEGAGWVFEVSGHTYHDSGTDFLIKGVLRNFQNANVYAKQTAKFVDEKGQQVDKVGKFLPGVKDPVEGNISHVFLLVSQSVDAPGRFTARNLIDPLIPVAGAAGTDPNAAPTAPPTSGGPAGPGTGGAAATAGWVPLTGSGGGAAPAGGSGGGDSRGGESASGTGPGLALGSFAPPPSGGPMSAGGTPMGSPSSSGSSTPGVAAPASSGQTVKKKTRYEFVICFVWKEPAPTTPGATPDAPK
ncbi:MAG: type IV pilus assembly protein PilM [Gemmataceae bacterium]